MSSRLLPLFLLFHFTGISQAIVCAYGDLTTRYVSTSLSYSLTLLPFKKYHSSFNGAHCKFGIITLQSPSGNISTPSANLTVKYKLVVHPRQPYDTVSDCHYNEFGYFGCVCDIDYCNSRVDIIMVRSAWLQLTNFQNKLLKYKQKYDSYGKSDKNGLKEMLSFLRTLEKAHVGVEKPEKKTQKIGNNSNYLVASLGIGGGVFVFFFLCGICTGALQEWKEMRKEAEEGEQSPGNSPENKGKHQPKEKDLKAE